MTTGDMPRCGMCGAWLFPTDGPPHTCFGKSTLATSYALPEVERLRADNERLRGLLREAQGFIVPAEDAGCVPGECAECDMHRLALRIDAALGVQGDATHG